MSASATGTTAAASGTVTAAACCVVMVILLPPATPERPPVSHLGGGIWKVPAGVCGLTRTYPYSDALRRPRSPPAANLSWMWCHGWCAAQAPYGAVGHPGTMVPQMWYDHGGRNAAALMDALLDGSCCGGCEQLFREFDMRPS